MLAVVTFWPGALCVHCEHNHLRVSRCGAAPKRKRFPPLMHLHWYKVLEADQRKGHECCRVGRCLWCCCAITFVIAAMYQSEKQKCHCCVMPFRAACRRREHRFDFAERRVQCILRALLGLHVEAVVCNSHDDDTTDDASVTESKRRLLGGRPPSVLPLIGRSGPPWLCI